MRFKKATLMGSALLLCGVSAASAGPTYLRSAPALPGTQSLTCNIVNLDSVPRDVKFEAMDMNGAVAASYPILATLQPNTGFYLADPSGNGAWCRFTVYGNPKKFRGVAIYDDGTSYTVTIPAY